MSELPGHDTNDFERLSWHDCHIWGCAFRTGEHHDGDFTSDLVLDIDFITAWQRGPDNKLVFRVAPADLVFHDVSHLAIQVRGSDAPTPPNVVMPVEPLSIDRVERSVLEPASGPLAPARWAWVIELNAPPSSHLRFSATGFTQTLKSEPVLASQQRLTHRERERLMGIRR